jgi:antitoxin component YwqK of YwqJK toxin-antitoxin module
MQELFEALKNFKPNHTEPTYYIVLKGREIECLATNTGDNHALVNKEDFMQLVKEGHQHFYFENGKIIRKPPVTNKRLYNILKKSSEGLIFLNSDPYWPTEIAEGGYTWQAPSE